MSTTMIHKKDHEGVLLIDSMTGLPTQPLDERPEWSEGLSTARLDERHKFYASRLGEQYAAEHKNPPAIAFEDLGWLTVSEDGETVVETEADTEFRMEVLATVLGVDRAANEVTFSNGRVLAEVELSTDRDRTPAEMSAFENAQKEQFEKVAATG